MTDEQEELNDEGSPSEELDTTEASEIDEPSPTPFDSAYESRRQRIFDHRVEAQADPDTTIACLAGVNSDLLDNELIVAEALRQFFMTNGGSLEAIEKNRECINLLLRFSKQIAQITQLEQRSRKGNGEASAPKPR